MRALLILIALGLLLTPLTQATTLESAHKIFIGQTKARALWFPAGSSKSKKSPAVILIPGTGPHGPESMTSGRASEDGKPHSLSEQFAEPFRRNGWNTLSLGKPGVDFFKRWNEKGGIDPKDRFYDRDLFENTTWNGLIENLAEGVAFLKKQPSVDSTRIYILAHSAGTQVASDYAKRDSSIAGFFLLGYTGQSFKDLLEWQIIQRPIEFFVNTDVDQGHKGYLTRKDTESWPSPVEIDGEEYPWPWRDGLERLTNSEIEKHWREALQIDGILAKKRKSPLYREVFERPSTYAETAKIMAPVYAFTGSLDMSTLPSEANKLKDACEKAAKKNCFVKIVPGVGHGFSPPKGPRKHPLLDMTVGPIHPSVLRELEALAQEIRK